MDTTMAQELEQAILDFQSDPVAQAEWYAKQGLGEGEVDVMLQWENWQGRLIELGYSDEEAEHLANQMVENREKIT